MMNETVKYADSSGRRRKHWAANTAITGMWEIKARHWNRKGPWTDLKSLRTQQRNMVIQRR